MEYRNNNGNEDERQRKITLIICIASFIMSIIAFACSLLKHLHQY
ncbi:MAG: hypothetical protein ACI4UN_03015 [Muribaculaceae bacterium]